MSGKNRAFAIAIATAALVGFSAPMALAATIAGPANTGFNGDSVLNLSNNQIPLQSCTGGAQANTAALGQTITSVLGLVSSPSATAGDNTAASTTNCDNAATETNTSVADTTSSSSHHMGGYGYGGGSNTSNSGFNGDGVLKVTGNQIPVQLCTGGAQANTSTALQTATAALIGFISSPSLTTGVFGPTSTTTCTNGATETNESALNS